MKTHSRAFYEALQHVRTLAPQDNEEPRHGPETARQHVFKKPLTYGDPIPLKPLPLVRPAGGVDEPARSAVIDALRPDSFSEATQSGAVKGFTAERPLTE